MSKRADAHMHLFEGGFQSAFTARPGVRIDEAPFYDSLAKEHDIAYALVVGYEGMPWAKDNNQYIAKLAEKYKWIRPTAYFDHERPLTRDALNAWREHGFVGISLYILDDTAKSFVEKVEPAVWEWLADHKWLLSVNTRGDYLKIWPGILDKYPTLQVLFSHMALPAAVAEPPTPDVAKQAIKLQTDLATYPGVHIKLSGFYAVSKPLHDYPHRAAWPYVEAFAEAFTTRRLVWGSDATPCLDYLSFPQTLTVFDKMPFLTNEDREAICGENLIQLLADAS